MYKRIIKAGEYDIVSILEDNGNLTSEAVWPDGFKASKTRINIFEVGWPSLSEFMRERPRFEKITE